MAEPAGEFFYRSVPRFERFADVADPACYRALPGDWLVGVADVVNSTGAIAGGRYKAVNIVGAGVICAVLNARGGEPFPFVFGGDGAVHRLLASLAFSRTPLLVVPMLALFALLALPVYLYRKIAALVDQGLESATGERFAADIAEHVRGTPCAPSRSARHFATVPQLEREEELIWE